MNSKAFQSWCDRKLKIRSIHPNRRTLLFVGAIVKAIKGMLTRWAAKSRWTKKKPSVIAEDMNTKALKYIAVDGPIGAGKTTLAKMLAEDMGGYLCLEPSDNNPFLQEFYKDRKKNAFKTQLYFLLNRYQQQKELRQQDMFRPLTVGDYTFAKDAIFAELNLSEDELGLYNTIFGLLQEQLPKPDIVIYLRAEPKTLLQRIKKKGIDYERHIDENYLEGLIENYNSYFMNYEDAPLLVVDSTDQNYVERREDFETLKKEILSHRGGTVHLIARS